MDASQGYTEYIMRDMKKIREITRNNAEKIRKSKNRIMERMAQHSNTQEIT